jgi:hypothetical protein
MQRASCSDDAAALRRRIAELETQLRQRDALIAELSAVEPQLAECVSTDDELRSALERALSSIVVGDGAPVTLAHPPVLDGRSRVLTGGCGSTLVGSIALKNGSELSARGLNFIGMSLDDPVIAASSSMVTLADCVVCNGRDGVHLSGASTAALSRCRVDDNVRGVFESARCAVTLEQCKLENNTFHMVLLGKPGGDPVKLNASQIAAGNTFRGGRGCVAAMYNPITDTYGAVAKGGAAVMLSEDESTTNLVDPAY